MKIKQCELLRKHLQSARITNIEQLGFERACRIDFEARDDMNFRTKKKNKVFLVLAILGALLFLV